jgi:hypothetical protein
MKRKKAKGKKQNPQAPSPKNFAFLLFPFALK